MFLTTYQKMFINLVVASYLQSSSSASSASSIPPTCFFNVEGGEHCSAEVMVEQLANASVCIEMGFLFSFAFQEAFSLEWLHLKTTMANSKKKEE